MTTKLISSHGSHKPATLSDADIVSNTRSAGATLCSNGLRAAAMTAALLAVTDAPASAAASLTAPSLTAPRNPVMVPRVNTPITKVPGATFPLGRIYVPGINIKTK